MHADQRTYVALVKAGLPEFFTGQQVLEVGSLDVNGSVRDLFDGGRYVGVDVAAGPGVDVVCAGEDYDGPGGSFDTVISCECLEHNPGWSATVTNMVRLLRPGGLFILSCAGPGRAEHGTPRSTPGADAEGWGQSYYRNLTAADVASAAGFLELAVRADWMNWAHHDLYLLAVKADTAPDGWEATVDGVTGWVETRNGSAAHGRAQRAVFRVAGGRGVDAMWSARKRLARR